MEEAEALATRFYEQGRLQDADQIVSALRGRTPVSAQIVFLSGKLHEARGDWAGAISEYRYLLTARPDLTRVRLELARALYASGEYDQARFHFERALGDDPPAAVRSNIERYLDRIRRRRLALDLSLDLVPDDNFNQAPADGRLILFGQEYVLSQAARPRSGLGLWVGLHGRLAPSSGEWTPFLTVSGDYQSYPGSEFDFLAGDVSLGVQRRMASGWYSIEAGYLSSAYGGHSLYDGPQLRAAVEHRHSARLTSALAAVVRALDYPLYPHLSGPNAWLLPAVQWRLSSTRAISLTAGVGRTEADEDAYAYYAFLLSPALALELPRGWSLGLALHAQVLRFDAEDPLFGRTRHDRLMQAQVTVQRRDWHLLGFSPRLALLYTRRDSNLALYDFRRMQFLIGFTREF